jgi:hypothetical protein
VLEHVLAVGRPELQPAEHPHELRVHVGDPGLEDGPLPGLPDLPLDLGLGLLVDLLDPDRLDAAVADQLLEGQAGHLPADRVETGEDDRLGGVVDDEVRAGGGLEGPDVAPLTPDDAAFHVLVGERDRRDGGLRREL